jgi:large-conductance mechanosensitive channel
METGGQGTEASWPHEVPLGKPFPIRQPFWQWGLGAALIDSAVIAVVAILVSLLIQAFAVFLVVRLISRVRRRWRHRREVAAMASAPAARPMS